MQKYMIDNDKQIISGSLTLYSEGLWIADLVIDTTDPLPSDDLGISMTWIDDTEFNGTLGNNTVIGGKTRATILGGTARLADLIPQRQFQSVSIRTILQDIARATGHTLSSEIDPDFIKTTLPAWVISTGRATDSLELLLQEINGIWQIKPDGTLWVGPDEYPDDSTNLTVLNRRPSGGYWTVYNDEKLLKPPFSVEGIKINSVEYILKNSSSTVLIHFTPFQDNVYEISSQETKNIFRAFYRCRVVGQNSDGSLELQLDPANTLFKDGLSKVPYCPPVPNMKITPKPGTHCVVAFLNGSPAYPRVVSWDDFIQPNKLEISADGANPAARVGDEVGSTKDFITWAGQVATAINVIAPGTVNPVLPPSLGKISTGSLDVSIG